jgi:hypothetical protein
MEPVAEAKIHDTHRERDCFFDSEGVSAAPKIDVEVKILAVNAIFP